MDSHPCWARLGISSWGFDFCLALARRVVPSRETTGCSCFCTTGYGTGAMATCILTAVHIFPPANKTDGSWLEKPGLCRKGNLSEGEDFGSILPIPLCWLGEEVAVSAVVDFSEQCGPCSTSFPSSLPFCLQHSFFLLSNAVRCCGRREMGLTRQESCLTPLPETVLRMLVL